MIKAMTKTKSALLGVLMLFSSGSFAAGMSCYVDTPAYDVFSANYCFAVVWGANTATAVFRVDNLPSNYYLDWHSPNCAANSVYCTTTIRSFINYTASATLINLNTGEVTEVSAVANFEDGR